MDPVKFCLVFLTTVFFGLLISSSYRLSKIHTTQCNISWVGEVGDDVCNEDGFVFNITRTDCSGEFAMFYCGDSHDSKELREFYINKMLKNETVTCEYKSKCDVYIDSERAYLIFAVVVCCIIVILFCSLGFVEYCFHRTLCINGHCIEENNYVSI